MIRWQVLTLALALPAVCVARASGAASPAPTCEAATRLPPGADDESRRIACEIPPAYRRDVSIAQTIGRALRAHDLAAWLSTDALKDAGAFNAMPGAGRGWLTRHQHDRILVRYLVRVGGDDRAFAQAALRFEPWGVADVARPPSPGPIDAQERALLRARDTVVETQNPTFCTPHPPNTVSFEIEEDGTPRILVFLLSAWMDEAPLGGFHMYRVSADGSKVEDHFAQTEGCPKVRTDALEGLSALHVSHSTSAAPTMFHVFLALQYRKPLVVLTTQNGLLWKVEGPRIQLMREDDPMLPAAREWADEIPRPHRPAPTSSPIG